MTSKPTAAVAVPLPERLLAVATKLFAEQGFESTSVQEVVEAAGVTKGALYHYYSSKDDLLHEIYRRLLAIQTERMEAIAADSGPPEQRLHDVITDVLATSLANLEALTVFFRSMHMLPTDKRSEIRAARRRYHDRVVALVKEGQRSGAFRDDIRPDIAVHYFFGSLHQIGTWYHPDGPLSADEVAEHFARLFMDGVRVQPAVQRAKRAAS